MSILKQFPDINLLCNEDAGWLKTNAYEVMLSILDSFSDIDVVFAQTIVWQQELIRLLERVE